MNERSLSNIEYAHLWSLFNRAAAQMCALCYIAGARAWARAWAMAMNFAAHMSMWHIAMSQAF